MNDEQMLLFETGKGLCLFAGCCHPGILNCLEYVSQAFPGQKLHSVFAGMHLTGASAQRITETAGELEKRKFDILMPVHCTGIEAIGRMKTMFGERCRLVGDRNDAGALTAQRHILSGVPGNRFLHMAR